MWETTRLFEKNHEFYHDASTKLLIMSWLWCSFPLFLLSFWYLECCCLSHSGCCRRALNLSAQKLWEIISLPPNEHLLAFRNFARCKRTTKMNPNISKISTRAKFLNIPYIHIWISSSTESLIPYFEARCSSFLGSMQWNTDKKAPRTQVLTRNIP